MTHKQLLALARKVYGQSAYVREHRNALDASGRGEAKERMQSLRVRNDAIDLSLKTRAFKWQELVKAARFVVDVNGDAPSIPSLAEVLADADEFQSLLDERADNRSEIERLRGKVCLQRWEVLITRKPVGGMFAYTSIEASGDTCDECAAKIRAKNQHK